jgi:hypothetical protein
MSSTELSDRQLLAEVKAAVREKRLDRAKLFFDELHTRGLARLKAKVANDIA